MHEVRRQLGLVDEQLEPLRGARVLGVDHLEGDALREADRAQDLGLVDRGHPTHGDLAHQSERTAVLEDVVVGVHGGDGLSRLASGARAGER